MNASTTRTLPSVSRAALAAILAASSAAFAGAALAQKAYPSAILRLVIPFAPGAGPDAYLRPFALKLSEQLGQPVVVENRVAGAGVLYLIQVARAAPDGHTLTVMTNANLIQKKLQPTLGFDPIGEFAQVSKLLTGAPVRVVASNWPAHTLADLLAVARASPGKLNYGSGGIGTPSHLAGATLQSLTGIDTVHIPFKNPSDVVPNLLRGDLHFAFQIASFAIPMVRGGKLRALGVASRAPMRDLPEVAVLGAVLGNDLMAQDNWVSLAVPAAVAPALVRRLHRETLTALAHPPLVKQIQAGGNTVAPSASPEEQTAYIKDEFEKWGQIVKLSGAKAE
ncbi:MAG: tripartite tricarboxylate transporter substrate binding protein [Burkholderiales bacterium]|nr:tripartite tricarboxylate transporter substrate binding protein [Burkholderiales bacterium]